MDKKAKVRRVTLEELTHLAARLSRVTRFNLTGALLCFAAMIYYVELGSQLLPKVFGVVALLALTLAILSYRTGHKVAQVIAVIQQKRKRK